MDGRIFGWMVGGKVYGVYKWTDGWIEGGEGVKPLGKAVQLGSGDLEREELSKAD